MNGAMTSERPGATSKRPTEPVLKTVPSRPCRIPQLTCTRCGCDAYDVVVTGGEELCIVCVDLERRQYAGALTVLLDTVEQTTPESAWWSEVGRAAKHARELMPQAPAELTREEQAAEAAARG